MWRRTDLHCQILRRLPSHKNPWLPSLLHYSDSPIKKGKAAPLQERKMRDRVRVWAKGGEGGNGCWSFRRSRADRYGKADGGNGGRGGDVILESSAAVWDFSNLQHHLNAKKGGHGESKNRIGSRGSDKVVQVPVGTVIHLVSGETPSFVEDISVKSLHPWDIPITDEADSSKSLIHAENVSSLGLSEREDNDEIPSRKPKLHVRKSARFHSTLSETRDSHEAAGKANVEYSCHRYESDYYGIKAREYDVDEYETESEENNEENEEDLDEEENVEEFDEEYEEEEDEIVEYSVAELTKPGQRLLVARGGEGGLGNVALTKSGKFVRHNKSSANAESQDGDNNLNPNPSLAAGMPGAESLLVLELKSIADIGLIGMPNAGKSTLLGVISRAKPSVGHYAFTTLRPNIGNLSYDDFFSVTVADIPGLIKGAHVNRGLGHAFLRHIERTKVLAYVVDLAAGLDGRKGIPPWEQLRDLVLELEYHQEGLSCRPSLVVANKIDEEGTEEVYEELKRRVKGIPIFPICAVLEEGVPELKAGLRRLMDGSASEVLDLDKIAVD